MNILDQLRQLSFAPDGDATENALFRQLGEMAASNPDLELEMEQFFLEQDV